MSRLTASARRALPASDFAAGKGHYPIEDIEHGRKAVQMASHAGPAEAKKIDAKVHAKYPSIKIAGMKGSKKKTSGGFGRLDRGRDDHDADDY